MQKFAALIPIIGIVLTLSFDKDHVSTSSTIDWYANGEEVMLQGIIVAEPDKRPLQTKYTIAIYQLIDISTEVTGNVLVTDRNQYQSFAYGDHVEVTGKLEKPEPVEDFAYDKYLSINDIYSVIYRGNLTKIPQPPTTNYQTLLKRTLYNLKARFEKQINKLLPEPHASFMAGLLTGSRRGIPEGLMQKFNITGLTHIIAISGYNITIVIALISGMLFWLPPRYRLLPSVSAIILFTIFVGASAAVIRACIMGILGLLALHLNRKSNARLSILWTAFAMIAWNPKIFWYDAGFQLSFVAVIGLSELSPYIKPLLTHVTERFAIRESLLATLAANIATLPLIAILFGRISLISPLANMLVAPAIPLAMLTGFIVTIISFVFPTLGLLIAYSAWALLEWIILVATITSKIPFASIATH